MSVIAELSVAPVTEGSMSEEVARAVEALESFDVSYKTYPMGTVIEADSVEEVFRAAQAAHEAVRGDRVSTLLKIDDKRGKTGSAEDKVASVENALGRRAENTS